MKLAINKLLVSNILYQSIGMEFVSAIFCLKVSVSVSVAKSDISGSLLNVNLTV